MRGQKRIAVIKKKEELRLIVTIEIPLSLTFLFFVFDGSSASFAPGCTRGELMTT